MSSKRKKVTKIIDDNIYFLLYLLFLWFRINLYVLERNERRINSGYVRKNVKMCDDYNDYCVECTLKLKCFMAYHLLS